MIDQYVLIFQITSNMLGKDAKGAAADTRMIKDNLMEWLIKGENEKVILIFNIPTSLSYSEFSLVFFE